MSSSALGNTVSKIVAIESQPLVRWAIQQLLSTTPDLEFAGEARTIQEGLALVDRAKPHLAVIGMDYSDGTGFALIKDLRLRHPQLMTLVYATQEGNAYAEHFLGLGARGYVSSLQTTAEFLTAVREVLQGHLYLRDDRHSAILSRLVESRRDVSKPLTERLSASEFEVFHLVASGLGNQDIANKLHRSIKTVETYRGRIKEKLGIGSSVELAQFALRCLRSMPGTNPEPSAPIECAAAPLSAAKIAAPALAPQVLIVDDYSISREPLAIILRQNGFKTQCAGDGQEAIDKIVEHDPSLVLLDLLMPQVNGIRVLEFIRETPRYRSMPVIVMTALTGGELIDRARELKAQVVFKSETAIDTLLTAISRAVHGGSSSLAEAV